MPPTGLKLENQNWRSSSLHPSYLYQRSAGRQAAGTGDGRHFDPVELLQVWFVIGHDRTGHFAALHDANRAHTPAGLTLGPHSSVRYPLLGNKPSVDQHGALCLGLEQRRYESEALDGGGPKGFGAGAYEDGIVVLKDALCRHAPLLEELLRLEYINRRLLEPPSRFFN